LKPFLNSLFIVVGNKEAIYLVAPFIFELAWLGESVRFSRAEGGNGQNKADSNESLEVHFLRNVFC